MSIYQFYDDSGAPMDAHFEMQEEMLILHSRGGTIGTANAKNTEYGPALRLLLERIKRAELMLVGVWVDSSRVQNLPVEERRIFHPEEIKASSTELFTLLSKRMAQVGRNPGNRKSRGNSTKRLRFAFAGNLSDERIATIVSTEETNLASSSHERLSAEELESVDADHIWRAVQQLLSGQVEHPFGESTNYDVIAEDGSRLSPKTVFRLAASEALGFEVLPSYFVSGIGTPCFRIIRAAGYSIVSKNEPHPPNEEPRNSIDREWAEGEPKLVTHFRRERGSGIAKAKKKSFILKHGRLLCERCGLDPEEAYGPALGDACIEVHHKLPLAEIPPRRNTKLEDLMCVCANCHRVIHREFQNSDR